MAERSLLLVLHDVAPETWPDYRPFVEAVDALGQVPMTWLVVPDFHHRNPLEADEKFCELLSRRVTRGDELALHGFYHYDDAPPPRTPGQYFMRRIYTWEESSMPSTTPRPRPAWPPASNCSAAADGRCTVSSRRPG